MTAQILLCTAIITARTVEWCQRRCENWCHVRDKDLYGSTCDVHYPRPRCVGVASGETTVAQKATIMNSTMVLSADTSGRTLRVDMGWPARDERLVTVAEANAHRVVGAQGSVASSSPAIRGRKDDAGPGW